MAEIPINLYARTSSVELPINLYERIRINDLFWKENTPSGGTPSAWWSSAMDSDGSVIVFGQPGILVYISSDYGKTWSGVDPGDVTGRYRVECDSDGSHIVACGDQTRVYLSTNTGSSWTEIRPKGDNNGFWTQVALSSDGSRIFLGEFGGRLYLSTNTGSSWTEMKPAGETNQNWYGVAMSSDGTVLIAATYTKRVYISTDAGSNWSEIQPAGDMDRAWREISCSSDGSIIAICCLGDALTGQEIYISTNTGVNWSAKAPKSGGSWFTIDMSSDGSRIIVGEGQNNNGRIYYSFDTGNSWTETKPYTSPAGNINWNWLAVSCDGNGDNYVAGQSDDVFDPYDGRAFQAATTYEPPINLYERS